MIESDKKQTEKSCFRKGEKGGIGAKENKQWEPSWKSQASAKKPDVEKKSWGGESKF